MKFPPISSSTVRSLVFVALFVIVLIFSLSAFFDVSTFHLNPLLRELHTSEKSANHDQPRRNVWADLNVEETKELLHYLHTVPNHLNLTVSEHFDPFSNHVLSTELLRPNKSEALDFVDNRSKVQPPRWAHVIIYHGSTGEATLDEYMVGPLPPTEETQIRPLTFYHNSGKSSSPNLVPDLASLRDWPYSVADEISDITKEILGSVINSGNSSNPDGLEIGFRDPWIDRNGRTIRWCSFQRAGKRSESRTLLPQGLYMKLDTTGRDPEKWRVLHWFYNNVLYNSTKDFRAAWKTPGFITTPPNLDGEWTFIESIGDDEAEAQRLATSSRDWTLRHRYTLDKEQQFLSWMGFTFYVAFSAVTGVTLYDVRFKGERILYELGLQEALSQYAGSDPVQGAARYLDSFWGMGATMFEMVPGYDCPDDAEYMDIQFSLRSRMNKHRNAICLFEYTADYPLQRHTTNSYRSVSKNTYFVVRTVAVVGNYDYTIDYTFYLDGSIEIKFRASGYIQGAYYVPGESEDYGYRIQNQFASSLHDHVINFKADFDILGQHNTLVSVDIEPTIAEYPWSPGEQRKTMKLTQRTVETEAGLNWPANSASHLVVVNNNSLNAWGGRRGYRIMPGSGIGAPAHLTFQGSETLGRAAEWAQKDLWVSKQKDTEVRSSTPASNSIAQDPMIDFGKFIDGEGVVQEDLVIWFNLGNHHVPHSGDLPNTLQHTSASSVWFMPYNFHDRDPSRETSQGIRLGGPKTFYQSLVSDHDHD